MFATETALDGVMIADSRVADVLYKTTDYYAPAGEGSTRWDHPDLAIGWPLGGVEPVLRTRTLRRRGLPIPSRPRQLRSERSQSIRSEGRSMTRKYLVTGGARFIGTNFIRDLLEHEPEAAATSVAGPTTDPGPGGGLVLQSREGEASRWIDGPCR